MNTSGSGGGGQQAQSGAGTGDSFDGKEQYDASAGGGDNSSTRSDERIHGGPGSMRGGTLGGNVKLSPAEEASPLSPSPKSDIRPPPP